MRTVNQFSIRNTDKAYVIFHLLYGFHFGVCGQYKEFQVCTCVNKQCEDQFCQGFKQPTQYEKCRTATLNNAHQMPVSQHVYKVVAANTYMDCYPRCK